MSDRPDLTARLDAEKQGNAEPTGYGDPICEANMFATSAEGYSIHFKLIAPYFELIGLTQSLQEEFVLRSYTGGAHGQARGGGAPAPAPKAAGEDCPFCDAPAVEKTAKASGKPYLTCPNCNAVAPYKGAKDGKWAWREDRPK